MICSKIVDETHLISNKYNYIVDTNILLYLYGDETLKTENAKNKMLANKFTTALDYKCNMYIPAIVISEFINRYHKLEFDKIKRNENNEKKLNYKRDYRDTKKFLENNKFIIKTVKETILDRCKLISDGLAETNIDKIFSVEENQEFNDNLIIDIANTNYFY